MCACVCVSSWAVCIVNKRIRAQCAHCCRWRIFQAPWSFTSGRQKFSAETDALCPGRSSCRRLPRRTVWLFGLVAPLCARQRDTRAEREALHCTKDNQGRAESHVCSLRSQRHARSAPANSSPVHSSGISCVGRKTNRLIPSSSG